MYIYIYIYTTRHATEECKGIHCNTIQYATELCVCTYIYIYIRTYGYIYTTHVRVYTYIHNTTCKRGTQKKSLERNAICNRAICMYIDKYLYIRTYIYIYIYNTCTYIYTYTQYDMQQRNAKESSSTQCNMQQSNMYVHR